MGMLPKRLNLGCGSVKMPGFINIDRIEGADLQHDLTKKLPFEDGSIDHVYASHVLEHFPYSMTRGLLTDWCRVLKDGGILHIRVPDIVECCQRFISNQDGRRWTWWIRTIYGGQWHEGEFHMAGFDKEKLVYDVQTACPNMVVITHIPSPPDEDPEVNIIFKKEYGTR